MTIYLVPALHCWPLCFLPVPLPEGNGALRNCLELHLKRVCRAIPLSEDAVGSYPAFSPLPHTCKQVWGGLFSVALSIDIQISLVFLLRGVRLSSLPLSANRCGAARPSPARAGRVVELPCQVIIGLGFGTPEGGVVCYGQSPAEIFLTLCNPKYIRMYYVDTIG